MLGSACRTIALCGVVIIFASTSALASPVLWTGHPDGADHWYEAVKGSGEITWAEAAAAAEISGGHLVSVTSQLENEFVFSLISDSVWWTPAAGGGPWIGGYQDLAAPDYSEPTGGWRWTTSEAWAYTNWNAGEPNNAWGGEHSLQYTATGGQPSALWNDRFGAFQDRPWSYVVEYDQYGTGAVPEPSSLALFGLCLASLGIVARRKLRR